MGSLSGYQWFVADETRCVIVVAKCQRMKTYASDNGTKYLAYLPLQIVRACIIPTLSKLNNARTKTVAYVLFSECKIPFIKVLLLSTKKKV